MKQKPIVLTCILTLCISLALLFFTLYARSYQALFSAENLINIIFLLFMTILLMFVIGISIGKMRCLIRGLHTATERMELDRLREEDFAVSPELQEALIKYRDERDRLNKIRKAAAVPEMVNCDIEDFINSDLLDHIIRKSVCDSVSGFMTGFGMLGTFIGLIVGLRSFSTDFDQMQNSIQLLLNGIKTAFMTSVYGVVFSIFFNWIYRRGYAELQSALDSFLNAFHQQNVSNTQNIVNTRMLTAQEQQLRLMSDFTETMQQTMQQMQAVTENMPYRIHKIAEEYFKPMKTVLDESVQAMREEQAAQQKTAWHFNQLTGQMGDLCGKLTATGEQYSEVTDKLSEVSTSLSSSVQSMEGFMTEIQQANNNISQNSQVMIEQIVSQCKAIGEQSQVTKNLVESSESLAVASVNLAAEMDQQITNHKELLASIEKLTEKLESNTTSTYNTLHEHLSQIVCQLNDAVSKLEEQYTPLRQEMQEGLTESFRIYGSEIRQLIEQFSAVLQRMEHISDDIPNHYRDAVRQFIEEKDREMQRLLAQNVSQEQQTDRDHSSEETEAAAETVEEDAADAVFEIADGVIE